MPDRTCTDCRTTGPLAARGLCPTCYRRHRYHGTLPQATGRATPHATVTTTAQRFHTTPLNIIHGDAHEARHAAAAALRHLGISYTDIGRILGGRNRQHIRHLLTKPTPTPPAGPPPPHDDLCTVPSCGRTLKAARLCAGHYKRWRDTGSIDPDRPLRPIRPPDAPTLDLPVHDRTGYRNGCRCHDCSTDAVRSVKANRHRPQSRPASDGAAVLRPLLDAGMTVAAVARAAGVNRQTLDRWLRDDGTGVTRQPTINKVAAVDPPPPACEICDSPALGGGRWCWPCYQARAKPKPVVGVRHRRGLQGPPARRHHPVPRLPPSACDREPAPT